MKKIILILVLIGIIGIAIYAFYPTWISFFAVKIIDSKDKTPQVYIMPTSREVKVIKGIPRDYSEFSYAGLKFKVPWKEITKKQENKALIRLEFPKDKFVMLVSSPGLLTSFLTNAKPDEVKKIKDFFGEQNLKSNYNFLGLVLNSNPEQITLFSPRKEAIAKFILITLKSLIVSPGMGEGDVIYNFATNNIKGFQFGNPEKKRRILITFFDNKDNEYDIWVSGTQEEIDFILSSIENL